MNADRSAKPSPAPVTQDAAEPMRCDVLLTNGWPIAPTAAGDPGGKPSVGQPLEVDSAANPDAPDLAARTRRSLFPAGARFGNCGWGGGTCDMRAREFGGTTSVERQHLGRPDQCVRPGYDLAVRPTCATAFLARVKATYSRRSASLP